MSEIGMLTAALDHVDALLGRPDESDDTVQELALAMQGLNAMLSVMRESDVFAAISGRDTLVHLDAFNTRVREARTQTGDGGD